MSGSKRLAPVVKWRLAAQEFHAIRTLCATRKLPSDFEPIHLAQFPRATLTPAVQGVFAFLLHIWNTEHGFDLGQIQRWDPNHLQAFTSWVTGAATGFPCEYF